MICSMGLLRILNCCQIFFHVFLLPLVYSHSLFTDIFLQYHWFQFQLSVSIWYNRVQCMCFSISVDTSVPVLFLMLHLFTMPAFIITVLQSPISCNVSCSNQSGSKRFSMERLEAEVFPHLHVLWLRAVWSNLCPAVITDVSEHTQLLQSPT